MRRVGATALAVLAGLSCLSKPALAPQLFIIDARLARGVPPPRCWNGVVVRRVDVAAPFDGRELVYRTGDHRLERDPYAILAAGPAALIAEVIRRHISETGFAPEAREMDEAHGPELLMDVHVRELSGDFVHAQEPAGVVAIAFDVVPAGASSPLLRKVYERRIVLSHRTAEAVVTAWNQGLTDMLTELDRDLDAALSSRRRARGER